MFGRQCQMQCSKKYDIPAVGSGFTGIFTCSEKEGVFKPLNTAPNCTGKNFATVFNRQVYTIYTKRNDFFWWWGGGVVY